MNKVIYIGELTLNVSLNPDGQAETRIGDRLTGAAMLDGRMGVPTIFVGETGADAVGDHIVDALQKAGVDTTSVDRFTEGVSAVRIDAANPAGKPADAVIHSAYPPEALNPVWPRIDEGDVVVFGSYCALDPRNHARVLEMVDYAKARKARVVYLPYFDPAHVKAITRVMPGIFDNLEASWMVMATVADLEAMYPGVTPDQAFKDHIRFHCGRCLVVDRKNLVMRFFDGDSSWTLQCDPTDLSEFDWVTGAIAGTVRALAEGAADPDDIMAKAQETAHSRLASTL